MSFVTGEDTRMRFSLTPQPGESGFNQWLDAMKMVAKLQGGIPAEFRRKVLDSIFFILRAIPFTLCLCPIYNKKQALHILFKFKYLFFLFYLFKESLV